MPVEQPFPAGRDTTNTSSLSSQPRTPFPALLLQYITFLGASLLQEHCANGPHHRLHKPVHLSPQYRESLKSHDMTPQHTTSPGFFQHPQAPQWSASPLPEEPSLLSCWSVIHPALFIRDPHSRNAESSSLPGEHPSLLLALSAFPRVQLSNAETEAGKSLHYSLAFSPPWPLAPIHQFRKQLATPAAALWFSVLQC